MKQSSRFAYQLQKHMTNKIQNYQTQINEIAAFAKRNGFNPETQFSELMHAWIQMTYKRSIMIDNNKAEVMALVQSTI